MGKHIEFDVDRVLAQFDPMQRLDTYFHQLLIENDRINLVSRETKVSDLRRLAAESLLPFSILIEEGSELKYERMLDIGSGGGFPSIPILLTQPISKAVLVERTQKKASVLGRFVKQFELPAEIVSRTFEELRFEKKFDLISMRLVTLDEKVLQKILPILSESGLFIYYHNLNNVHDNYGSRSVTYSYSSGSKTTDKFFTLISKK